MSGPSPDASGMPPAAVARDAINEAWVAVFPDEDSRPARHIVEHDLPQPLVYGALMEFSCAFATSLDTPEHIRIAEALGYRRAWAYDSPALYPDVWVALSLAAERTERIGLGPAVLVPSLRHPMTNAAAIVGLCALAPGRVAVAVG